MSTVLKDVAVLDLQAHPRNPRLDLGDVTELAASIRELGLLEPIVVVPVLSGGYRVIAGHRRAAAAALAGLPSVPALLRDDLDTDAKQLEVMLVENLQRTDLTPIEEAAAYEQLKIFGYNPARISKATGRSKATVTKRLTLMKLSETARGKVHAHTMSLDDAEKMAAFADNPAVMRRLEGAVGTYNFGYQLQDARRSRDHARVSAKTLAVLKKAGTKVIDPPGSDGSPSWSSMAEADDVCEIPQGEDEDYTPFMARALAEHATCPHHAAFVGHSGAATYVCLDPETHPGYQEDGDDGDQVETAEGAQRRAEADKLNNELETASATRLECVRVLIADKAFDGDVLPILRRTAIAQVRAAYSDPEMLASVLDIAGIDPPGRKDSSTRRKAILDHVRNASNAGEIATVLVALDVAQLEVRTYGGLRVEYGWEHKDGRAADWLALLEEYGYQQCDVERRMLAPEPGEPTAAAS